MNRILTVIAGLMAGYLACNITWLWSGYRKTKQYKPDFALKQAWNYATLLPKETAFRKGA